MAVVKATLINTTTGDKQVVDSGSAQATDLMKNKGYVLMGANNQPAGGGSSDVSKGVYDPTQLGVTTEPIQFPQVASPFEFPDQTVLGTAMNEIRAKLSANADLTQQRAMLYKQLYNQPLTPEELKVLSPSQVNALTTNNRNMIDMELRLISDELNNRTNTLDTSIKYITDQYTASKADAEKQYNDAISTVQDFVSQYGSNAKAAMTSLYGQKKIDQLKTMGIDIDKMASLSTLEQTKILSSGGAAPADLKTITDAATGQVYTFDPNTGTYYDMSGNQISSLGAVGSSELSPEEITFLSDKTDAQKTSYTKIPSADRLNVMSLINGDMLLSDLAAGMGGAATRKRYSDLAKQVDPTWSENTNKIRYAFNQKWNSTESSVGKNRTSINTALGHLADAANAAKALNPTTIRQMNSVKNVLSKNFGDPAVTNFRLIINALAGELASVYKNGTAPTDQETTEWRNAIAESFSKQQFNGVFNTASKLLSSKITSVRYQYKLTMGHEFGSTVIDPDKAQELLAAGIDPNMIVKEKVPTLDVGVAGTDMTNEDLLNSILGGISAPTSSVVSSGVYGPTKSQKPFTGLGTITKMK